eukprot:3250929-Pyramimonas_sp.AAC.2
MSREQRSQTSAAPYSCPVSNLRYFVVLGARIKVPHLLYGSRCLTRLSTDICRRILGCPEGRSASTWVDFNL